MRKHRTTFNSVFGTTALVALLGATHAAVVIFQHAYLSRGFPNVAGALLRNFLSAYFARGFFAGLTLAAFLAVAGKIQKNRARRRRALFLTAPLTLLLISAVFFIAVVKIRAPIADQFAAGLSPWLIILRIILPALTDPVSIPRAVIAAAVFILLTMAFLIGALIERMLFRKDPPPAEEKEPGRTIGLAGLAVIAALVVAYGILRPAADDPKAPDILLVSIDTLRADHVGCYGYGRPTTPNIDLLAKEGVVALDHIAHSPWTLPAHISMFTGLLPFEHGVTEIARAISPRRTVLAEVLRERGYSTGGFVSNYLLSPTFGYGSGFDDYVLRADFPAEDVTRLAMNWLARHPRPVFLFVHLYDPHYPYAPRKSVRGRFGAAADGLDGDMARPFFDFAKAAMNYDDERTAAVIRRYDEEIADVDAQVGKLFDALRAAGRYDNAWIIVTSDHGEEFKDHGLWGHSITLYDEVLRVPLIVKPPGPSCAGRRVAGLTVPQKAIFDLVAGASHLSERDDLSCREGETPGFIADLAARDGVLSETEVFAPHRFSIRKDGRKLTQPYKFSMPPFEVDHGMELYDLAADAKETKNLYSEGAAEDLQALLDRAVAARAALEGKEVGSSELSPEAKEKLKSLGYIQ